jgi:hypothetical protein
VSKSPVKSKKNPGRVLSVLNSEKISDQDIEQMLFNYGKSDKQKSLGLETGF